MANGQASGWPEAVAIVAGLGAAMPEWMHDYTMRMQKARLELHAVGALCRLAGQRRVHDKYGSCDAAGGRREGDNAGPPDDANERVRSVITYFPENPSILIWEGATSNLHGRTHVGEMRQIATQSIEPYLHVRAIRRPWRSTSTSDRHRGGNDAPSLPVVEGETGDGNRRDACGRVVAPGWIQRSGDMMTPGYAKDSEQFAWRR